MMQRLRNSTLSSSARSSKRAVLGDTLPFGWKLAALGVVASTLLLGFILRPIWAVPTAHFVLPAGFNGPFVVASRSDRRATWPTKAEYELRVPKSGVLIINNEGVLSRWHSVLVSTADGAVVRVTPDPFSHHVAPNKVFVSKDTLVSSKFREHWFFFGFPESENDRRKEQDIENGLAAEAGGKTKDQHNR